MRFQRGKSGNPEGRAKGSVGGRLRALATLDRVLARVANQDVLATALEVELRENPIGFFKSIVMPLLPREAQLSLEKGGIVRWRSLVDGDGATRATIEGPPGSVAAVPSSEP